MPLHGLKVEKKVGKDWKEKEGMIDFFLKLNEQYDNFPDDEQGLVDYVFGYFVDNTASYLVTYAEDDMGTPSQVTRKANGRLDPPIKGMRDKVSDKKLHMVVPSQKPEFGDAYVSNIISQVGGDNTDENQKYLLGTILIRKCR